MMFVFALMGSLMFANKLKFHPDTDTPIDEKEVCPDLQIAVTDPVTGITSNHAYPDPYGCTRRAHFDTFLWSITTVFWGGNRLSFSKP